MALPLLKEGACLNYHLNYLNHFNKIYNYVFIIMYFIECLIKTKRLTCYVF